MPRAPSVAAVAPAPGLLLAVLDEIVEGHVKSARHRDSMQVRWRATAREGEERRKDRRQTQTQEERNRLSVFSRVWKGRKVRIKLRKNGGLG